ncbi:MAG: VWA domain-containing protein [Vicinamibacteraceae bacterium]
MHRRTWMVCLGVVAASLTGVRGQTPDTPRPAPINPGDWPTFKAGTRLATIDAVVIDDQGRQITDLKPSDFEVVERGATPKIHQAVYIRVGAADGGAAMATVPPPPASPPGSAPGAPRARPLATGTLTTGRVSTTANPRVLAIVVDDLGLSFESTAYVRQMLTRYVETQVQPGDLVAIIRTAGGVGTLQQFTTDRRLLNAAIDRVRWTVNSRVGVSAFAPVVPATLSVFPEKPKAGHPRHGEIAESSIDRDGALRVDIDKIRGELTSVGTLGALEYVLRGIEAMPGRKSVVFVSEGFDLGLREHKAGRIWSTFTRVMDRANRAGVVVYSVDARGLQTANLTAEDNPQVRRNPYVTGLPTRPNAIGNPGEADAEFRKEVTKGQADRTRELMDTQESLVYMAEQTGGFAVVNTNDLASGLGRIVDDTRGYYLIGFETLIPKDQAWDPNDVRVRVKRPGLKVRARRGLFGPADTSLPRDPVTADPLVAAALSPFSAGAIDVRLTTLFAHDAKAGSYVRALFFIDPAGLTFVDGPDGRRDADLTLLLLGIGDNGRAVGQARVQVPLRLHPAAYRLLHQRGLLYSARLPMKTAGGYQVRAAVQDMRSKAVGSSAQFVEVPKVGKGQLALSGVVMMDVASAAPGTAAAIATDALSDGVLGEPAVKIFRPGAEVAYTCVVYDGRKGPAEAFATTATLLRDGRPIHSSAPAPVHAAAANADVRSVPVGGRLSLGDHLPTGSYTLQVSVASHGSRRPDATQFVEFEVR